MKKIISEKEELRQYWLVEAISDKVEYAEVVKKLREEAKEKETKKITKPERLKVSREKALWLLHRSFDYDYRHYFDPYEQKPISEYGLKLFSFTLAEWRKEGKIW